MRVGHAGERCRKGGVHMHHTRSHSQSLAITRGGRPQITQASHTHGMGVWHGDAEAFAASRWTWRLAPSHWLRHAFDPTMTMRLLGRPRYPAPVIALLPTFASPSASRLSVSLSLVWALALSTATLRLCTLSAALRLRLSRLCTLCLSASVSLVRAYLYHHLMHSLKPPRDRLWRFRRFGRSPRTHSQCVLTVNTRCEPS